MKATLSTGEEKWGLQEGDPIREGGKKELAASPTASAVAVPVCTGRPRPNTKMYQVVRASAAHVIFTI